MLGRISAQEDPRTVMPLQGLRQRLDHRKGPEYRSIKPAHPVKLPAPGERMKVLLCLFGTLLRSIRYTWPQLEHNIQRLRAHNISTDVYTFNNDIEGGLIDGVRVNESDVSIISATYREELQQNNIDEIIKQRCGTTPYLLLTTYYLLLTTYD